MHFDVYERAIDRQFNVSMKKVKMLNITNRSYCIILPVR